ncbi:MAG: DUF4136 domain-containing protein [Sphingomonas sp.]
MPRLSLLAAAMTVALAVPISAAPPVRVTRFHLSQPIVPGPAVIAIAPDASPAQELEAKAYIDAVATALGPIGFTPASDAAPARYRVTVSVHTSRIDLPPSDPPVSIGLGGGGISGGGVGLGGSIGFGIGHRQPRAHVTTELSVRIAEATTAGAVIWEGRANQAVDEHGKPVQPIEEAQKLAHALFKDFPGQSGRTISVK